MTLRPYIQLTILTALFFGVYTSSVSAAAVVSPAIIDIKGKVRDIVPLTLKISNPGERVIELYPFVIAAAGSPATIDRWIEISRASVVLPAGEEKKLDLTVTLDLSASPGIYHASVIFAEGATRAEAQSHLTTAINVPVNIEVVAQISERLQLTTFVPTKTFFTSFPVSFLYGFENTGNQDEVPEGEIRIYDRSGREVFSVPVNEQQSLVAVKEKTVLASSWQGTQSEVTEGLAQAAPGPWTFGKYKAYLDVSYGSAQARSINDTVYFWVIPWQLIIAVGVCFITLLFLIISFIHKRYPHHRPIP